VLSEVERVQLKNSLFELVAVKKLVRLWRWHSKVIKKKWKECNQIVTRRLHM
jgi:hypothetical protein